MGFAIHPEGVKALAELLHKAQQEVGKVRPPHSKSGRKKNKASRWTARPWEVRHK